MCPLLLIRFEGEKLCIGRAEGVRRSGRGPWWPEKRAAGTATLQCMSADWPVESLVSVR